MVRSVWQQDKGAVVPRLITAYPLEAGDVGAVVHIHKGGVAYEVEFVTLTGKTIAVATVEASHLRPIGQRDINHVREPAIA
jgi:hypothetical protein